MDLMQAFNNKYLKAEPPVAEVGDTVRVHVHIKEGNRERIQVFLAMTVPSKIWILSREPSLILT